MAQGSTSLSLGQPRLGIPEIWSLGWERVLFTSSPYHPFLLALLPKAYKTLHITFFEDIRGDGDGDGGGIAGSTIFLRLQRLMFRARDYLSSQKVRSYAR